MAISKIFDRRGGYVTSTDETGNIIITYPVPQNVSCLVRVFVIGKDSSINTVVLTAEGAFKRVTGDVLSVETPILINSFIDAAFVGVSGTVENNSTNIVVQVTGLAATTIEWMCDFQIWIN